MVILGDLRFESLYQLKLVGFAMTVFPFFGRPDSSAKVCEGVCVYKASPHSAAHAQATESCDRLTIRLHLPFHFSIAPLLPPLPLAGEGLRSTRPGCSVVSNHNASPHAAALAHAH